MEQLKFCRLIVVGFMGWFDECGRWRCRRMGEYASVAEYTRDFRFVALAAQATGTECVFASLVVSR